MLAGNKDLSGGDKWSTENLVCCGSTIKKFFINKKLLWNTEAAECTRG